MDLTNFSYSLSSSFISNWQPLGTIVGQTQTTKCINMLQHFRRSATAIIHIIQPTAGCPKVSSWLSRSSKRNCEVQLKLLGDSVLRFLADPELQHVQRRKQQSHVKPWTFMWIMQSFTACSLVIKYSHNLLALIRNHQPFNQVVESQSDQSQPKKQSCDLSHLVHEPQWWSRPRVCCVQSWASSKKANCLKQGTKNP